MAQWSKALHCSVSCATRDPGSSPGSVATGRPMEQQTIVPASSGLGECFAGRDVLVPSSSSNSCGGPGAMHDDTVARCTLFPPTHWCDWLPGSAGIVSRSIAA